MDVNRQQICWAHLKRDFIQISERTGASAEIVKSLLEQEQERFNLFATPLNFYIDRMSKD